MNILLSTAYVNTSVFEVALIFSKLWPRNAVRIPGMLSEYSELQGSFTKIFPVGPANFPYQRKTLHAFMFMLRVKSFCSSKKGFSILIFDGPFRNFFILYIFVQKRKKSIFGKLFHLTSVKLFDNGET